MNRFGVNSLMLFTALACALPAGQASAAFRVTVTSGSTTEVFYSTSSNSGSASAFTIGDYSATIQVSSSNYPGDVVGKITQSVSVGSIASGSGAPANLSVTVDIIGQISGLDSKIQQMGEAFGTNPSTTLFALTSNFLNNTGVSTSDVTGAASASWSNPTTPIGYAVTADYGGSTAGGISGTGTSSATFNGTADTASAQGDISKGTDDQTTVVLGSATSYTLANTLTLSGLNRGASQFSTTSTVSVAALPVPASIILLLTGVPALAVGAFLRRRKA
jgi:hypothetical protein